MLRWLFLLLGCALAGCTKNYITENKIVQTPQPTPSSPAPAVVKTGVLTKQDLEGKKFYFLKSIVDVSQNAPSEQKLIPGIYLETNRIVEFRFNAENTDVDSAIPLFDSKSNLLLPKTLANFQTKAGDGNSLTLSACTDYLETSSAPDVPQNLSQDSKYDAEKGLLNLRCTKRHPSGTVYTLQYSFLRVPTEPSSYVKKEYPRFFQKHFGFFKTTVKNADSSGMVTGKTQRHYVNRWNPNEKIVYYYSKGFPERLKPAMKSAADAWNEAFFRANGKRPLELRENSGQELGSLGENIIYYSDRVGPRHSVLGYSPQFADPETGQYRKAGSSPLRRNGQNYDETDQTVGGDREGKTHPHRKRFAGHIECSRASRRYPQNSDRR